MEDIKKIPNKVEQFIQLKDTTGMLKNLSELLQEVRDRNITSLFLGYTRGDQSMRTFWHGGKNLGDFNLLLDQIKFDFVTHKFDETFAESYKE